MPGNYNQFIYICQFHKSKDFRGRKSADSIWLLSGLTKSRIINLHRYTYRLLPQRHVFKCECPLNDTCVHFKHKPKGGGGCSYDDKIERPKNRIHKMHSGPLQSCPIRVQGLACDYGHSSWVPISQSARRFLCGDASRFDGPCIQGEWTI